jgi:hypothetical protein
VHVIGLIIRLRLSAGPFKMSGTRYVNPHCSLQMFNCKSWTTARTVLRRASFCGPDFAKMSGKSGRLQHYRTPDRTGDISRDRMAVGADSGVCADARSRLKYFLLERRMAMSTSNKYAGLPDIVHLPLST